MCGRKLRPSVIVAAGAVLWACTVHENILARVGAHDVQVDDFQAFLHAETGEVWESVDERVAARLLDHFLDQEVVEVAAGAEHEVDPSGDHGVRSARARELMAELCGPVPPLPDDEISAEMDRRGSVPRPPRAHVRQLLLTTRADAEAARERLAAGEDFLAVSREMSRAPNAARGGEIGMLSRGTLPEDLEDVIFSLEPGGISQPVESPSGVHVFQVLELVPAGPVTGETLRREVVRDLGRRWTRRFREECVGRLAAEVGVTVYPDNLWFRYLGRYAPEARDEVD